MKILLVDDDAFLRDMYATKFKESGDEVMVAENGAEALNKLEDNQFDVVVMDMIMPGMTGVDLIKSIKSNPDMDCRCIVLSNQGEEHEISAARSAGAEGYIIKAQVIPSELVKQVRELVIV